MNNDSPIDLPAAGGSNVEQRPSTITPEYARRSRAAKHLSTLESFLRALDITFFIQLSTIYYLDCRLLLLLMRAFIQVLTFARVPTAFRAPTSIDPTTQPVIGLLFSSNLLCLSIHLVGQLGHAGELTQFYQHGGILVDFIGERTPISRLRLVVLDILVCAIQLIMLAASIEKARLSKIQSSLSAAPTDAEAINLTGTQTIDSEERGENADINEPLLADILSSPEANTTDSPDAHPLDSFTTGRHLVVDINLSETVRRQWRLWKHGTSIPIQPSSSDPVMHTHGSTDERNNFANLIGPFGFRVRVGGRALETGS